jgi:catechol 2,3-dioxygenase-like lactoylglutathione lyase family enzyme
MPEPLFTDTTQIAIVVRDLDEALHTYVHEYGIGPWRVYEIGPKDIEDLVYDDEPLEYAMRIALAQVGRVEWELIQPTDDKGPYVEFLKTKGEGLHHVGVSVRDYDEALGKLRDKGHTVHIGGVYQGARLSYVSTDRDLKAMTEIVDPPETGGPQPSSIYPPEAVAS